MERKELKIWEGKTEVFLICDKSLTDVDAPFFEWLRREQFKFAAIHGNYGCCPWAYVNITRKQYAYAMPGVNIVNPIGNHAITIKEFEIIYYIYKKYNNKDLFVFNKERFDYDSYEK